MVRAGKPPRLFPISPYGCMHIRMHAHTDGCTYGWMHIRMHAHTDACTYGCMYIRMFGWILTCHERKVKISRKAHRNVNSTPCSPHPALYSDRTYSDRTYSVLACPLPLCPTRYLGRIRPDNTHFKAFSHPYAVPYSHTVHSFVSHSKLPMCVLPRRLSSNPI